VGVFPSIKGVEGDGTSPSSGRRDTPSTDDYSERGREIDTGNIHSIKKTERKWDYYLRIDE